MMRTLFFTGGTSWRFAKKSAFVPKLNRWYQKSLERDRFQNHRERVARFSGKPGDLGVLSCNHDALQSWTWGVPVRDACHFMVWQSGPKWHVTNPRHCWLVNDDRFPKCTAIMSSCIMIIDYQALFLDIYEICGFHGHPQCHWHP